MAKYPFLIDWEDASSHILMNPRYSESDKSRFRTILNGGTEWPSHIWLSTSGSSAMKWVGLSKSSILASADSVNKHLNAKSLDRWIHALPDYHVGGLGIWARAFLTDSSVSDYKKSFSKWDPHLFHHFFEEEKGTLTALVPAQLHDLVTSKLTGPSSLKAIIIGGGILDEDLYQTANQLGWKVLPSYGMTECASQVATACLSSLDKKEFPHLKILDHLSVEQNQEGIVKIKGNSLLSTYAFFKDSGIDFIDPKKEGWYLTGDRGKVGEGTIKIFGRADQVVKIGGENVDLAKLESILLKIKKSLNFSFDLALLAYPDERLGTIIHLCVEIGGQANSVILVEAFNSHVLPFERIRKIHFISKIPRNELSKLNRQELIAQI